MLVQKDQGEAYDKAELARLTREAVIAIVRRQAEVGVDIINDGEMSKPGYSTYVADRLSGFAGHEPAQAASRHRAAPEFHGRLRADDRRQRRAARGLRRPDRGQGRGAAGGGPRQPEGGAGPASSVIEGFMTAASPGLVPVFQTNRHYPTYEAYVEAIAAAMQAGIRGDRRRRLRPAARLPRLGDGPPHLVPGVERGRFPEARARFMSRCLNHALRNVPADMMRIHICWGNYEGPHDHDIDFAKVAPILVKAKPMALVVEAANPRHAHEWAVWQRDETARRQGAVGRRPRHLDQLCRASRSWWPSASAALPTSSGASG